MRRFAALALAASLLHLNVVRADAACGEHGYAIPPGHSTTDHAMEHEGGVHTPAVHETGAQEFIANEQSCETPSQPECCQALASCSPAFGPDAESTIGAYVPSHDVAVAALSEIPLSRVATPDPPPPKE